MNYYTLTTYLSKRLGIDKNIFLIDFDYPTDKEYKRIDKENVTKHYYLSQFEHWANTKERWKSTKIYILEGVKVEVVKILNEYLQENGEQEIDENDIPKEFSRYEDNFNLILGHNEDYLIIEIANKEN